MTEITEEGNKLRCRLYRLEGRGGEEICLLCPAKEETIKEREEKGVVCRGE
jgi:hypothetical protein